jgi:serine/threonine protein phosphatase PrpC
MGHTVMRLSRYGAVIVVAMLVLIACGKPPQATAKPASSQPTPTPIPTPAPTPGTGSNLCVAHPADGKAPPLVSLDAYSFHPEHVVGFYGQNFQPHEGVQVLLGDPKSTADSKNNQDLTTVNANNGGDVAGKVHIAMMTPGKYFLYFVGQECTVSVSVMLLPFAPWVVLDNYAPFPHYLMGFRGQGFAPNEPVDVYLNEQGGDPIAQIQADTSGQFAVNQAWNVGDLSGDNTLLFVGTYTHMVVSVQFEVQVPQTQPTQPGGTMHLAQFATPTSAGAAQAPPNNDPSDTSGDAFPFFSLDPFTFVLGFLILWFVLCIVLAVVVSVERIPLWGTRQSSKQPKASPTAAEGGAPAEATRWLTPQQRGLPTPGIQVSSKTERGQMRAEHEKEDHFLAITGIHTTQGEAQPFALLIVADSVGHYTDGQSAGRRALHAIFQALASGLLEEDLPPDVLSARLEGALQGANRLLYWQNQRESANTSCSVAAALVSGQHATICSVGNSRAYVLPAETALRRVTTDHSIVERCLTAGMLLRGDMSPHLKRSRLYRSLGQHPEVRVDTFRLPMSVGDQLLLCSNGLWEILAEAELEMVLRGATDILAASTTLIEQAKARSNLDHITAITLRFVEAAPAAQQPGIDTIASGSTHPTRQPIF